MDPVSDTMRVKVLRYPKNTYTPAFKAGVGVFQPYFTNPIHSHIEDMGIYFNPEGWGEDVDPSGPSWVERRVNSERRKTTKRTLPVERRKIIRRACDRASSWRRGFWRDQQRRRFEQDLQLVVREKLDNLLFSNKRVIVARRKAMEHKALLAQQLLGEKSRLAKAIGAQHGLDVNVPAQSILTLWQQSRERSSGVTSHNISSSRKMRFYRPN